MKKKVLNNGLVLYYYPIKHAYSISVGLYIKSGAKYEAENQSGITHLLEHMHFRRLGVMTQEELYRKMDMMGANLRASTYKELLKFQTKSRPCYFNDIIGLFSEIISMYDWTEEDLESEKRVILNEICEKEDYGNIGSIMDYMIWGRHSLSNQVLGNQNTVCNLTLSQIKEYKKRAFSIGNVALVITGEIMNEMECFAEKCLNAVQLSQQGILFKEKEAPLFHKRKPNVKFNRYSWEYVQIDLMFDIDSSITSYEVVILNSILGGGTGAKLQGALREKLGLTYDIYSEVEIYLSGKIFHISLTTHKSNIYQCIENIISVLKEIKLNITEMDIKTNIPYFTDNLWYWLENTETINEEIGWELFSGFEPHTVEEHIDLYREVTKERLTDIAKNIFAPHNASLMISGKTADITKKSIKELLNALAE